MRTFNDLAALERGKPAILTIGTFDGVHRGHQWLIRQVVERSRRLDYESVVISFDPAPQVVLRPGSLQLTGAADKERLIAALGPSILALLPFNHDLSQIPAAEFLVSILDHINLAEIWTGADFVFGHKRGGNVDLLIRTGQNSNFAVHVVPRKDLWGTAISSTRVRELVSNGDTRGAAELLGHYPGIGGTVVSGFGRGAQLGFPTANIRPPESQLLPANGIYAAFLRWKGTRYPAAVSVGYNVVFGGQEIVVEAYVLDFAQDLREQEVGLDFVERIREEQNFDRVEELVAQMHRDIDAVRAILAAAEEPGELLLD